MSQYLLGFDIGSSSIKACLLNTDTGQPVAAATSPDKEISIHSPHPGWAEQDPEVWWEHVIQATRRLIASCPFDLSGIAAIGISYQMHGLVLVDKDKRVLRPSIIWCDSRAVAIGDAAFKSIGQKKALSHLLNSPGNFTASKLKWVKENEPETYEKIYRFMLPGDYIAMKMTGEIKTTLSGLSEGVFWDFKKQSLSDMVLGIYDIDRSMIPEHTDTFSIQGELSGSAAEALGLRAGIPLSYRAGDQPNNAFSLNVLNPGEVAATAGTSGVIYGITGEAGYDPQSRVNTFVHVNHEKRSPRYGVLLCINGTGIMNSWLKHQTGADDYPAMNTLALETAPGSDGVRVMPFGNGAERVLGNIDPGAMIYGLNFNRHHRGHLLRAAQEGIVFSLNYGFDIMKGMGMDLEIVRAGKANMFLSPLFREAFVNTTETVVELYNTNGAQGAARAAGIGAGIFDNSGEAFEGLTLQSRIVPEKEKVKQYKEIYSDWLELLNDKIL